jgi:uridine kinase
MASAMYLIGIAGPSGSGKTELARALAPLLDAPILALDLYYRDLPHLSFEERAHINFDVPEALDHELLIDQVRALAEGAEIDRPVYDFTVHRRRPERERFRLRDFGILEGLWTLHWPELRELFQTKVYVETGDAVCLDRRLARDVRERGRSPESVFEQYRATVRPMAELYIHPQRELADVVVSGCEPVAQSADQVLAHVEHAAPDSLERVIRARAALSL